MNGATSVPNSVLCYVVEKGLNFGLVISLFLLTNVSPNKTS